MSEAPQIPRLLAALLGVEPPPPSGPPRTAPPPGGAPVPAPVPAQGPVQAPVQGRSLPVGPPVREGRDTAQEKRGTAAPTERTVARSEAVPSSRSSAERPSAQPQPDAVGAGVRRILASRDALRTGVVVAEVLGRPRATRPYGTDLTF